MSPQEELQSAQATPPKRKPRILWATVYCLLDTSSGASISAREMLRALALRGYDVAILGATIFDDPKGVTRLKDHLADLKKNIGQVITAKDGPLVHKVFVTEATARRAMTSREESRWRGLYAAMLDRF